MNYTISSKIKKISYIFIALGIVGVILSIIFDNHTNGMRLWANLLTNSLFFMYIALGATFFLAVQYVAVAGWSAQLTRIMEAIASFLPFGAIPLLIVLLASSFHLNHLFHWMDPSLFDPSSKNYDEIIAGKAPYLNQAFFWFRTIAYILIWSLFIKAIRKKSLEQDLNPDLIMHKKLVKISVLFIIFFAITSVTSAWDWIMSIDAHWFSTIFGWYIFSSYFISAIIVISLLTVYLKEKGLLPNVNENHFHDLGKFIFAFSIFWTYLWFAQFLLIWYANKPEEVTYFLIRWEHYKFLWSSLLVVNFVFPFLILMTRNAKRKMAFIKVVGVIVLIGHWFDMYLRVFPGTVKANVVFGLPEIFMALGFLAFFALIILNNLAKTPLIQKNHPFLEESVHHNI